MFLFFLFALFTHVHNSSCIFVDALELVGNINFSTMFSITNEGSQVFSSYQGNNDG